MKRLVLLLCSIALLAASAFGQVPERGLPVVDQKVYAQLEASADGTTYVIVMLQPVSFPGATLMQLRIAVQQVQDIVLSNLTVDEFSVVYQYRTFAALTGYVNADGLEKLAKDPNVTAVGIDGRGEGHLDVSVPFINADDVHALGYTGDGITVAVLDSGIDSDHPDLSDDIAAGWYHYLDQGATTGPGAEDDNGHGTNVSGIITSKGTVASVGVAPDADILAIKVIDAAGSGWISDWAAGVDHVVSHQGDYDNLCIINMSLGSFTLYSDCPCDNADTWTQLLHTSIQAAKNAGIVTFASSGNDGSCTSMSSPACLSSAVAVAAVYDQSLGREPDAGTYSCGCFDATTAPDMITCFSNRLNLCNELAAPGRLITAPGMGGGTSTYTGTSQAAPHCSGVAALMYEKCGCLHPDSTVQIMKITGVPTVDPCATTPNPRRVDALAAVNACGDQPPPPCLREGDPAFYVDFGEDTHDMIAGETYCWTVGPCNFGFVSATCPDTDTFCVYAYDTQGWVITGDPPLESCFILDPGYLWWQDICITAPCAVVPCDYNTFTIVMTWCDNTITCRHDCNPPGDADHCEDPNWYGGNPYYSTDVVTIHIVESPPALYIVQDSVYYVEEGQTAAYVPFTICNGDACADPTVYNYTISCTNDPGNDGDLCAGFPQAGSTAPVPGGECQDVYGVVDAGYPDALGDKATLEIIAWDITGAVYDTCVQIVEVVEQQPVPLFTAPVVTILVLAMILASAVIMKRHTTSRA